MPPPYGDDVGVYPPTVGCAYPPEPDGGVEYPPEPEGGVA